VRLIKFLHETMGFDVVAFEPAHTTRTRLEAHQGRRRAGRRGAPVDFRNLELREGSAAVFEYIGIEASARTRSNSPVSTRSSPVQSAPEPAQTSRPTRRVPALARIHAHLGATVAGVRAVVDRLGHQYYRDTAYTSAERDAFTAGSALLRAKPRD